MEERFYRLEGFEEGDNVRVTFADKPDVVGLLTHILSGSDGKDDDYVQFFVDSSAVAHEGMLEDGPDALEKYTFLTIAKEE